jgi:hypothetical protein
MPDKAHIILLVLNALDDSPASRRDLRNQLVSEDLAQVVELVDGVSFLDEPLLDGRFFGAFAQVRKLDLYHVLLCTTCCGEISLRQALVSGE